MSKCVYHKPTQNERILSYLREFGTITQYEAIRDLGIMRLASRICDMRMSGYNIVSDWVKVENRWGEKVPVKRYRLGEE